MPWSPKEASSKTKKATSSTAKKQWARVANSVRARTGNDGLAIKEANGVLKRRRGK